MALRDVPIDVLRRLRRALRQAQQSGESRVHVLTADLAAVLSASPPFAGPCVGGPFDGEEREFADARATLREVITVDGVQVTAAVLGRYVWDPIEARWTWEPAV